MRPILRIDVLQNDEIAEILCNQQWSQLADFGRTRVRGIRRPEKRRRAPGNRFEQKLRRIELQPDVLGPAKGEIRVVIGMISDLVAFRHDPPNESRVFFRVCSDEKKSRLHVCCFQDIEHLGRPFRVGSIIESEGDLMRVASTLMIERWELWELRICGGQIAIVIQGKGAQAIRLAFIDRNDFTFPHVGNRVGAS